MNANRDLQCGDIVADRKGRWYIVAGLTDIFGIPAVKIGRVRRDGVRIMDRSRKTPVESVSLLDLVAKKGNEPWAK